ncbi:hypothetical protein ACNPPY_20350 [Achromobacter sp. AGC78]|uniref:Uncharacterized protein n=1 Tax=Achromobacter spanius TaxID=217203 RepID=A0AA42LN06_9BURK|nr:MULTISPECIES: hypothetical protein [Achromobacter]MCS3508032.1 hypothetical protein [Achromobacter sp. JUb104]MDH0734277.1 hypothetical protein [Achromobacter spanius]
MRSTVRANVLVAALCLAGTAAAQAVDAGAGNGPAAPPDDARAGKNVLNAGPEPRVKLPPGSRDHAAIFGSDDEDEQALASQEQTLENQRNQLLLLERLFTQKPASAAGAAPAMMPLNTGSTMRPLQPTPAGSQLDRGKIDEMQRRVDSLRREADTLRQSGK